ncbi:hypothetical protein V1478_017111 [Vespula squamosa]|uniref:Uncharacterized protein n=1 Tax=Vespula squamosa TaxID=30214 RepID=A0ABD1ZYG8_VESSQ
MPHKSVTPSNWPTNETLNTLDDNKTLNEPNMLRQWLFRRDNSEWRHVPNGMSRINGEAKREYGERFGMSLLLWTVRRSKGV